jgi:guanylate kinase
MTAHQIDNRILEAKNEIMKSIHFDHLIVNEDFEDCYQEVEKILQGF